MRIVETTNYLLGAAYVFAALSLGTSLIFSNFTGKREAVSSQVVHVEQNLESSSRFMTLAALERDK